MLSFLAKAFEATVRLLGAALICFGLVTAYLALNESWMLYREPERIERFRLAVEAGSRIDASLHRLADLALREPAETEPTDLVAPPLPGEELQPVDAARAAIAAGRPPPEPEQEQDEASLRFSYYFAWLIIILLLLLIARIAFGAITAGAHLALYGLHRPKEPPD